MPCRMDTYLRVLRKPSACPPSTPGPGPRRRLMCTIPRGLSKHGPASPSTEVCCSRLHHQRMLTWLSGPRPGWTKCQFIPRVRCSLHLLRSTDSEVRSHVWVSLRGIFTLQLGNTLTASARQETGAHHRGTVPMSRLGSSQTQSVQAAFLQTDQGRP